MDTRSAPVAQLFYFNPNTYSTEYFVAAYSREEAIAAVRAHIVAEIPLSYPCYDETERAEVTKEHLEHLERYISEHKEYPHREPYRIEAHPIGKVIQTEIS